MTKVYISDLTAWCNIKFGFQYSNPLQYAHHLYLNEEEITNLIIPEGIKAIGDCAFEGCSGLTSVTIPKSVTNIGSVAFSDCSSLTEVYISDLTAWCNIKFGSHVFTMPHHLYLKGEDVKHLVIPDGITSINDFAFQGCSGLTSVNIPNSVTSIGYSAFERCCGLTSVTIPNSVTTINDFAFDGCSGLTSVTIPNSVTSINDYAFFGCSSLTSVTIPNSVTSINDCAFQGCSGLTSVTIPNSVTSIGDGAFRWCSGLTEVYSLNLTPPSTHTTYSPFDDRIYQEATLYVPKEALETYRNAEGWKNFKNIQSVESSILYYFDYDDSNMTATITRVNKDKVTSELVIPETTTHNDKTYTVVAIGDEAFKGCEGLTSVTIPNSITAIGDNAFNGCSGLTKVNISDLTAWCNIRGGQIG